MNWRLPAKVAWRYLWAPKSHNAVNAISMVSVAGVAVATAAIVCVLSVFNGFRGLLAEKSGIFSPDVIVTPAEGRAFTDTDSLLRVIRMSPGVGFATPTLTDNALAISGDREMPVTLKGVVRDGYPRVTSVDSLLQGQLLIGEMEPGDVSASVGVAHRLGLGEPGIKMFVFAPKREGRVNMANPMNSFVTDSLRVVSVFQAQQSDYDEKVVVTDLETAQRLFQREGGANAVEIKSTNGYDFRRLAEELGKKLGSGFTVRDKLRQQEMDFRMVEIEKWVTFLLLVFILLIATFNIISTMSMLVIEKERDLSTLRALGMTRKGTGSVFWWESVYVSVGGGVIGILFGVVLCLAQEWFGLIRLGGSPDALVVQAYPVKLEWLDLFAAMAPVMVLGIVTATVASAFAKQRTEC